VDSDEKFAAVIRLSQPFNLQSAALAPSRGAIAIFSMLDAIAYDCLDLCTPTLPRLWQFVMQSSDAVIYISKFSKDQFARRFASGPDVRHAVSLPSTELEEYKSAYSDTSDPGTYLLLIGNHFAHKAVRETVYMLRDKLPDEELRVLGIALPELPNVVSLQSGALHDSAVWELYSRAKAVVFPSHYEGFGLPVLHALGNRKVIFVRDLPVYQEIRARISAPDNIRVFTTNQDLIKQLADADFDWKAPDRAVTDVGWDRAARELEAELSQAAKSTSAEKIRRRLEGLDLLTDALNTNSEAQDLAKHLQLARSELDAMYSSTSWRITAPLRRLRGRIAGARMP
jgi:glycosyltransferase involved in cell wall biosynthesis